MNHFGNKSQKEFRLNSGSLKPEFSQFAGFKLLELNMRSRARLKREPKTSWLEWGELKREARNVYAPGAVHGSKREVKNVLAQGPAGNFLSG